MGYHASPIKTGRYGEPSKIQEELEELSDSLAQGNRIMALQELSDIYGVRSWRGLMWVYGTGVALPRLQQAVKAERSAGR